jgi:peptide/nickel transport system permease protein
MTEAATARKLPALEPDFSEILRQRRNSYWSVVGRAYWHGRATRNASAWAILLLFLTVFVPFIANDAPYTAIIDNQREFPLFRDLTREDIAWLIWGFAVSLIMLIWWRSGKKKMEQERLRLFRWKATLIIAGIATLLSAGVGIFGTDYLDVRDYHVMAEKGELRSAIYPPLNWGYAYQESKTYEPPGAELADSGNALKRFGDVLLHARHKLGTDWTGCDVLSRLLWSARIVLEIGMVSEIIALIIGCIYGALMGYFVGKVDIMGMRFVEIVEAIPLLFLLITFIAIFGRQLFMIMVIIGITGWTGIARFVRAEFLRMRNMDYVSAAKAMGLPLRNILFRHMLPNALTPVIVSVTFGVAGNIVSESILSFLGIGVVAPTASWGAMLDQAGNPGVTFRWWLALFPGIMIFLTVFAYNIIGEGLRDAIDPKTNKIQ